jgi:transposase
MLGFAVTDKVSSLEIPLVKRAFLGWLRGEPDHCSMAAIPTLTEEDAKRPGRERESLVGERTRIINRIKGAFGATWHPRVQADVA